ncbi:MAG: hypothetical protein KZQ78_02020 [Candidatus Thiodiazotropha sp. (ex Ustalcina ferruginea)]|nr:hypothetical protein [Candidatus Thiodiazotropha sp. (ex Ustalcina ferruginea)]
MSYLFPRRLTPSTEDDILDGLNSGVVGTQTGASALITLFVDAVKHRQDAPIYLTLSDNAAICLHLSEKQSSDADGLIDMLLKQGAQLYLQAYMAGDCPILRAVLLMLDHSEGLLSFESPLLLTNGDVQTFCDTVLGTERIQLHIMFSTTDKLIAIECLAHGVRRLLGGALDDIRRTYKNWGDPEAAPASVAQMEQDFPQITSGLDPTQAVRLEFDKWVEPQIGISRSFN